MSISAASERLGKLMMISIRPRHVAKIVSGHKSVELRRTRPAIVPGQPVAIYSTIPDAAIVAVCRVSTIDVDTPADLWRRVGDYSGIARLEFDGYFAGRDTAVALHLTDVCALQVPVPLGQLRNSGAFHPPQTWHFIGPDRIAQLVGDHPSRNTLDNLVEVTR